MRNKLIFLFLLLGLAPACDYDLPAPGPVVPFNPGSGDFQRIAVLGTSQSSGSMDGALYQQGQQHSWSALLAQQININNDQPVAFQQPDVASDLGYNPFDTSTEVKGKYFMTFISPGSSQLFKGYAAGELPGIYSGASLNNYSIPGMRTTQAQDAGLSDNIYYQRIASAPGSSTVLGDLLAFDPSLIFLELGWDDIIPFARHGLTGSENADADALKPQDLTPFDDFEASIKEIVARILNESNSDLILFNIPDVSKFPFFNSISSNALINGFEAGLLQNFYRDYNLQVTRYNAQAENPRPVIQFFSDDPPSLWKVVVEDPSLPEITLEDGSLLPKYRQMEEGEYVLWSTPELPTATGGEWGTFNPLPKRYFFTNHDMVRIGAITNQYNAIIADLAASDPRILLLDCYQLFEQWSLQGINVDGVEHTYDFTRSGIFSSDGITLNQRGSALLTNRIIDLLNLTYGSNITPVNANGFSGNEFVNNFD